MTILDAAEVKLALEGDAAFNLSLRFLTGSVLLRLGETAYLLRIEDGKLINFDEVDGASEADVVFSGPVEAWQQVLRMDPPPGCQGLLYNDGRTELRYEGDPVTGLGPLARPILELERILRRVVSGYEDRQVLPEVDRDFDTVIGRYMYVRILGVQYRIYFEEAGEGGIPLVLQHTAGADSRQSRHIMNDPDFQKRFRMFSYDLPFHGRSLPPTSERWWESQFKLTKEFLLELVLAISSKLELDRPVFMGSAMGGMLALDLAYYHPDDFRAVIAFNAGPPAQFDDSVLDQLATFSDPRIGRQWTSTMMVANMASTSPEIYRREVEWVYSQAAPSATEGALNYFTHSHDLTPEQAAGIDTSRVAVYLFTGEDDSMGTPFGTDRLAAVMDHVPYKRLRRLGHFGVAENPDAIKADIWPVLEEIIGRSDESAPMDAAGTNIAR